MTDLSLAQHRSARCGFTSSAISTNYAALVIGRCGSIHSGFGSAIQTCHKEAPGRAPRASGLPKYPPARPRRDAPQRPRTARINVRFAPKATEVLRWRRASYSITSSASASSVGGTPRPKALAVLRLITNSNLVACWTGKSEGFAPLRILSTNVAERYHVSVKLAE